MEWIRSRWKACDVSYSKTGTFHQGGITSSLKFPFLYHIEDNIEFGWGVGGELRKEVLFWLFYRKCFCIVHALVSSICLLNFHSYLFSEIVFL